MDDQKVDSGGMRIPMEKLLATIGRLTVENEMLRELLAQRMTAATAGAQQKKPADDRTATGGDV
jgi:regulator of replication initiation timing